MLLPLNVIVDVLTFSNRNDLDILSEINRYLNRIVQRHFSAKPYRILDGAELMVDRDDNELLLSLMKFDKTQSAGKTSFFDFLLRKWIKFQDFNGYAKTYYLETMLYYLPQYVRIAELQINFRTIGNELHSYTTEDFARLAQLSHVWNGQQVSIYADDDERVLQNHIETISNGIHLALSNPNIINCRQLSLYNALHCVSFHSYAILFLINTLALVEVDGHTDIDSLITLIRHKAIFRESKTEFMLDIFSSETSLIDVMVEIYQDFSMARTRCSFRLLIVSYNTADGFRLENENTMEVLQTKIITEDEARKYCHFKITDGMEFYLVERFSV